MRIYEPEFLDPLQSLVQRARTTLGLTLNEEWRIEMTAGIAAARACGVSSETLEEYEALLKR